MRYINTLISHILIAIPAMLGVMLSSCTDDVLYNDLKIYDGTGSLRATISFKPLGSALRSRSSGTAIKTINNLCIVMYRYDAEQSQYTYYNHFMANEEPGYTCDEDGNQEMPNDFADGQKAETSTPRASFNLHGIPFGKYKIYAVANLGNLEKTDIETEDNLRNITSDWNRWEPEKTTDENETIIASNNAMFGYFTDAQKRKSEGFEAPEIVINKKNTNLHAWIKRLASKVTVSFDASGLNEAVWVYIKSISIKDIPKTCKLGITNKPNAKDALFVDGETLDFSNGSTDYNNWGIKLTRGEPYGGSDHNEESQALYFFENMQGDFENSPDKERYNKEQNPNEVGESINEPIGDNDYKDRVPYGTYIEVAGYYRSQNPKKISSGTIKYRFMLGKNTTYNYDAERNYHYQLTLKLKYFANDADWHIVYEEPTPSLYTPSQYFISYLYNQSLDFPVRILTGDDNVRKYTLRSDIIENNWAPYDYDTKSVPSQWVGAWNDLYGLAWNTTVYNSTTNPYNKNALFVGFLSMRKTQEPIIGTDKDYRDSDAAEFLKDYYINYKRGYATYSLAESGDNFNIDGNEKDGQYSVKYDVDKSVIVTIPMFTRAKEMIPSTDFTANNPFDSYMRKAVVRFTLLDENGKNVKFKNNNGEEVDYSDVPIYQVRHIVNPKAIWRSAGNEDEFHVVLTRLPSANASKFVPFQSEGRWRASILVDPNNMIRLYDDVGNEVTNTTTEKYINGSTGTNIDFWYKPAGTIGSNETRCGIILVEYHDYTCNHLIFVRQGYDAPVYLGNAQWSCYSAYATSATSTQVAPQGDLANVNVYVTESPLSIGSYFKRNNYAYAIREANSQNYGWLKSVTDIDLSTAYLNGKTAITPSIRPMKWGEIQAHAWTNYSGNVDRYTAHWADTWTAINRNNTPLTVPTYEQYVELRDKSDFGYGVVYGDGATSTATNIADAYGYTDYNNEGTTSQKGIRACIIYDKTNGNQIIFPLGSKGQGRRARTTFDLTTTSTSSFANPGAGALTYSGNRGILQTGTNNSYRPLTYNLYRSPGAVYWFKQPARKKDGADNTQNDARCASWDINYFTFVFNGYDHGSLGRRVDYNSNLTNENASDALPIRLIYK